jgi:hypothetical protein
MSYTLTAYEKIVFTKTAGSLTYQERKAIVEKLGELNVSPAGRGLIVDHQMAEIDMELAEAVDFSKLIIQLQENAPYDFIYVIASEKNRHLIDLSVVCARIKGISITVCESASEALNKVCSNFPSHYDSKFC